VTFSTLDKTQGCVDKDPEKFQQLSVPLLLICFNNSPGKLKSPQQAMESLYLLNLVASRRFHLTYHYAVDNFTEIR